MGVSASPSDTAPLLHCNTHWRGLLCLYLHGQVSKLLQRGLTSIPKELLNIAAINLCSKTKLEAGGPNLFLLFPQNKEI